MFGFFVSVVTDVSNNIIPSTIPPDGIAASYPSSSAAEVNDTIFVLITQPGRIESAHPSSENANPLLDPHDKSN